MPYATQMAEAIFNYFQLYTAERHTIMFKFFKPKKVDDDLTFYTSDTYYDVEFNKELSNGTILFMIVSDEFDDYCGHILLTSYGKITIIPSTFFDFDNNDREHLESTVKKFYEGLK